MSNDIAMTPQAQAAVQWGRNEASRQGSAPQAEHLLLGLFTTHAVPVALIDPQISTAHLTRRIVNYQHHLEPVPARENGGDAPSFHWALHESAKLVWRGDPVTSSRLLIGAAMQTRFFIEVYGFDYTWIRKTVAMHPVRERRAA